MSTIQSRHFVSSLPRIIKNPSQVLHDRKLLADTVPLATLLAPIGPLVFSPLIVNLEAKKKDADHQERKKMLRGELIGQSITVGIHMLTFLGGGFFAKRLLPRWKPNYFKTGSDSLENAQTTGCILGAFLGITFIRPFVTVKVLKDQDAQKSKAVQLNSIVPRSAFSG